MQQFCPLSTVRQRISLGAPLPFNVRSADHTLLLAGGQVIETEEQLAALFARGALVDTDELRRPVAQVQEAPIEELPSLWKLSLDRIGTVLKASVQRDFANALDEAARPVLALIDREPDLAIFQIVRQALPSHAQYGVIHSMHAAIASQLAAARLGWDRTSMQRLFKAALTMNLAMLELQGRLATQVTPLTPAQREAVRTHPMRSVQMLQEAGVTDEDWLEAVQNHHEAPGGGGYPRGLGEVSEIAQLLRRADIYTAKLSPRATRGAMPANAAARAMFVSDAGHPMTAALVKEFGVYPPGCYVRLNSGETGVVIKRGETANTPIVASLTDRRGDPMLQPLRRNTAAPDHAIVGIVDERSLRVRVCSEQLLSLG